MSRAILEVKKRPKTEGVWNDDESVEQITASEDEERQSSNASKLAEQQDRCDEIINKEGCLIGRDKRLDFQKRRTGEGGHHPECDDRKQHERYRYCPLSWPRWRLA